jgi:hypothetical protein
VAVRRRTDRLLILESDRDDSLRTSSFSIDVSVSDNIIRFVGPECQRFLMLRIWQCIVAVIIAIIIRTESIVF